MPVEKHRAVVREVEDLDWDAPVLSVSEIEVYWRGIDEMRTLPRFIASPVFADHSAEAEDIGCIM